jgi:uncharacterized protein YecE (DUF72 family)
MSGVSRMMVPAPIPRRGESMAVRIGASGWVYPHWKGLFFPEDLAQSEWLAIYARRFDTVEINNTFYHLPGDTTFDRWEERVP